jgi:hypothetical protein
MKNVINWATEPIFFQKEASYRKIFAIFVVHYKEEIPL